MKKVLYLEKTMKNRIKKAHHCERQSGNLAFLVCKKEKLMDKIKLSNGYEIPSFCFGTDSTSLRSKGMKRKIDNFKCWLKILIDRNKYYTIKDLYLPQSIDECMKNGINLFDTSRAYGASEFNLSQNLKNYKRNEYFIVTKVSNAYQFKDSVEECLEISLKELETDYVDVYLLHWPVTDHWIKSWKVLEELYKKGKCKAIGVCNCNIHHLEELKKYADIMPMVNEFECHPLFTQNELREYCKNNNIQVMAYTSTARMDTRLNNTCLSSIAKKYGKTVAQVILRWHLQIGNIPIVNSTKPNHIKENANIYNFELTPEEVSSITAININSRLRYDPDNCDFTKL